MAAKALFEGLVQDVEGTSVEVRKVGGESYYVVDDAGFLRHIDSDYVDRQVLSALQSMIQGNEDLIADGAMKMLGQEDIFSRAVIEQSLKNTGEQMESLLAQGFPDEARTYLGMMGFRIVIDHRGDLQDLIQPAMDPGEEE